jgi:hypothetical protein
MNLRLQTALATDASLSERRQKFVFRLCKAEEDHAIAHRSTCEGASAAALNSDNGLWLEVGDAIAALARLIQAQCAKSQFCGARPKVEMLAARLSEAIDDQLDVPCWAVVDAAARLGASRSLPGG